jgi:O-antigen/teichoic acid export membrane protein
LSASPEEPFRRGAATLSVGIGVTGLVTYAFFSLASHSLGDEDYGRITLLWSAVFVVVSVLYRPVEQLLARTIAERDALGVRGTEHLRVSGTVELAAAAAFVVSALALRGPLQDGLFAGSATLYWILIAAVVAYAASYFARGYLAGSGRFGLYGLLVFLEASTRVLFPAAVALGLADGLAAVALGIVAAPLCSLAVVPLALAWRARTAGVRPRPNAEAAGDGSAPFTLARGAGFASSVLVVMAAEQTLLNAGPLLVKATHGPEGTALAGFAFNVLLIARAPLQLFQSVQTAILPHLTRLMAAGAGASFRRSVNVTLLAIAVFATGVAGVVLVVGPGLMTLFFGPSAEYDAPGLVVVAIGMGFYLAAATLSQALLARAAASRAAACWVAAATAFVALLLVPFVDRAVLRVELAYAASALVLCVLLYAMYRRAATPAAPATDGLSGQPDRAER